MIKYYYDTAYIAHAGSSSVPITLAEWVQNTKRNVCACMQVRGWGTIANTTIIIITI
jgi:hypothetical protein